MAIDMNVDVENSTQSFDITEYISDIDNLIGYILSFTEK